MLADKLIKIPDKTTPEAVVWLAGPSTGQNKRLDYDGHNKIHDQGEHSSPVRARGGDIIHCVDNIH